MRFNTFTPDYVVPDVPVLLISLPDQDQRRCDMVKLGVPDTWVRNYFPATDLRLGGKSAVDEHANPAELERRLNRPVRASEVGCALSHRAVCLWLANSDFPMALILEDDIVPSEIEWLAQVKSAATVLLPHARAGGRFICHLGARHDQADAALKRRVVFAGVTPEHAPRIMLHTDPGRTLWRAHAYLISRHAAKRCSDEEKRILTLADDWGERRRRGWIDELFYTRPILIGQDEERPSTIRPVEHHEGNMRPLVFPALAESTIVEIDDRRIADRVWTSLQFRLTPIAAQLTSRLHYRIPGTRDL